MTDPSMDLFRQACGAAGPLRLAVERTGGREVGHREIDRPFALVGREVWADLTLDDPEVSRRHAYLQVIAGRVFCLDLESRAGVHWEGRPRRSGWLDSDRPVGIGPFAVRLVGDADTRDVLATDPDPLAPCPTDQDPLPAVSLEVVTGGVKGLTWRMNRVLALVGQAPGCKVRVADWGVGLYHCGLLRTPLGLWVVDLLGSGGVSVNRTPVRWARLGHGDELLVGDTLFGIRYDPAPGPSVPSIPGRAVATEPSSGPVTSDADRLRSELAAASAEADALRGRVAELEPSSAELAHLREALGRADAQQRDAVDAARAEVEGLRAELDAIRGQLDGERAARAEAVTEADALRVRISELERSALDAAGELERLRAELDAARDGSDRERAAEREQAESARSDLAAARAEAEGLRTRVAEVEQLAAEAIQALEAAEAKVARTRQEADALREERDRVVEQTESARSELATVLAGAEGLRGRVAELEPAAAELAHLREALGRADAEQRRQRDALDAARAEAEGLRAELERSADEVAASREAVDRARREESARWDTERQELRGRLAELTRSREADRGIAAEALAAARADADRARAEAEFLRKERAQAEALRAELEAARAATAEHQARLADLERSAVGPAKLRADLAAVRGQLDDERASRQAEVDRLRQRIEVLRQDRETLIRRLAARPEDPDLSTAEFGTSPGEPGEPPRVAPEPERAE